MKKARQIVIPSDRPLTFDEFQDFKNHALNSSLWYASEYMRSEKQVIDKLLAKGYTREEVEYVDRLGEVQYFDIMDFVIRELKEGLVLSDESYARGLINRYSGGRRGSNYIRNKLREKGVSSELADELLSEMKDEEQTIEAVGSLADRYMNTSSYLRVEDKFKRRQKLLGHLISRGYSFDDISLWENSLEE